LSDKPADKATKPPRSKKLLLVVAILLVIVALGAGGAWFYVSKQRAAALDGEEEEAPVAKVESKEAPTYLPLDNMVVNLADPGGEKVAQIGITLELSDAHATDKVKQYLPTIRSGILLLVSQKTSEELLQREGKEKLAADILKEAARPFGGAEEEVTDGVEKKDEPATKKAKSKPKVAKKNKSHDAPPVQRVLFSSFIVQ
jgi:flagellar FliL protein